jgi:beta-lactam-binding protein with PASTA domain
VVVPSVVGTKRAPAADQLRALGFKVSFGATIPVENENDNNRVMAQSVAGGSFIAAGSTIVLRLGEYTPPPEE